MVKVLEVCILSKRYTMLLMQRKTRGIHIHRIGKNILLGKKGTFILTDKNMPLGLQNILNL